MPKKLLKGIWGKLFSEKISMGDFLSQNDVFLAETHAKEAFEGDIGETFL